MKTRRQIILSAVVGLTATVASGDGNGSEPPKEVTEFVERYNKVVSDENQEAYKKLLHPNGSANRRQSDIFQGWKAYDPRPKTTRIEVLHSEHDLVILRLRDRTHFPEYPLFTIDTRLVVLRRWEKQLLLWSDDILDSHKVG